MESFFFKTASCACSDQWEIVVKDLFRRSTICVLSISLFPLSFSCLSISRMDNSRFLVSCMDGLKKLLLKSFVDGETTSSLPAGVVVLVVVNGAMEATKDWLAER